MSDPDRVNAAKPTRGRPFQRGNPGRPRGSRNKSRLTLERLLEDEGEALARQAIQVALTGDVGALRLCLDRIMPARKDRHVSFLLPTLETAADAVQASGALVQAVAAGELTPGEASDLAKLVEGFVRALEVHDVAARLAALEARDSNQGRRL